MNLTALTKAFTKDYASLRDFLDDNRTYGLSIVSIKEMVIDETITIGTTSNTLFQAASISKSIFAATIMRLYEKGAIDIYQDIAAYLDPLTYPTFDGLIYPVTLYDLLTHTAGFNSHGFAGYLHDTQLPTLEEILTGKRPSNSIKLKMIYPPKTKFMYSGGGFMLAQYILEKITNKSYQDWADELIFKPLNMHHSTLSMPLDKNHNHEIATGWSAYDTPLDHGYVIYPELAAAGLWTTPSDLACFGIEIMKAYYKKSDFLTSKSAELMMTIPKDIKSEYGLGFHINTVNYQLWFGHGGDNTGFHSRMAFCPNKESGIIVMVNSDIGDDIPNQVLECFIKQYMK
jgi:CubicO group peptidase (beta-lactamase class C family)